MRRFLVVALFVVSLATANIALAGTYDPGIQDKIIDQQRRIDQGIASGALTRHEAGVLQDNLNWIRDTEARLKADGRLTPAERNRLHRILERNSNMIYNKKHNRPRRVY
ncbi:MAG: hypothetical protein L0Y62_01850 [Nitrospirae bacterium]|nr:hypothetical protein [Nitrospirota bacterium]